MQNKSFLVRLAVEEFEGVLIKNGLEERVSDIIDARKVLARVGLENLNPDGRGGRNFMEEQQRAVYDYENWDMTELGRTRTKEAFEEELDGIVGDPAQLEGVLEKAKAITDRQAARSKSEHDALGDVNNIPIEGGENEQT